MSISVVIPYFNNSEDIERCLKSVISQTLPADEVHLIDDCSSDSDLLLKIINKYSNVLTVNYSRNNKNKNAAYSRNYGIKKSTTTYIALLDADDYWSDTHLEESLLSLKTNEADFVYSNIKLLKNNVVIKLKVSDISKLNNPNDIILFSPPQTGSFFFKKTITDDVRFDENLKRHQDYQFLLDIVLNKKKVIYNDVYTSYYYVPIKLDGTKLDFISIFFFWNKYKDEFSEKPLQKYLIRMLCLNMKTTDEDNITSLMSKYEVLNVIKKTSFYFIYTLIGDEKKSSKMLLFLFFKIRYDLVIKLKCIIKRLFKRS